MEWLRHADNLAACLQPSSTEEWRHLLVLRNPNQRSHPANSVQYVRSLLHVCMSQQSGAAIACKVSGRKGNGAAYSDHCPVFVGSLDRST